MEYYVSKECIVSDPDGRLFVAALFAAISRSVFRNKRLINRIFVPYEITILTSVIEQAQEEVRQDSSNKRALVKQASPLTYVPTGPCARHSGK
jgi:hypothetical protein